MEQYISIAQKRPEIRTGANINTGLNTELGDSGRRRRKKNGAREDLNVFPVCTTAISFFFLISSTSPKTLLFRPSLCHFFQTISLSLLTTKSPAYVKKRVPFRQVAPSRRTGSLAEKIASLIPGQILVSRSTWRVKGKLT